jgi:hypothetical protein
MKKILLLVLLCFVLSNAWSQTEEQNVIKFNPLSALVATGSVFYEHKIDDKHSWQLGLAYMGLKISNVKYSGLAITPEYRIYLKKNALSGVYVGPYLRSQNYTLKDTEPTDSFTGTYSSFGGGVVFGRQWIYRSGLVFDLFAGPSFNSGNIKVTSGSGSSNEPGLGIDGFGIRIGMAFGFGF